jgi:hypothetical protein
MIAASISQERRFSLVPFLDLKAQYRSIKGEIDATGIGKGEEKQGTVLALKLSDNGEADLHIPS